MTYVLNHRQGQNGKFKRVTGKLLVKTRLANELGWVVGVGDARNPGRGDSLVHVASVLEHLRKSGKNRVRVRGSRGVGLGWFVVCWG